MPVLALNNTEAPLQSVVDPPAVILADGNAFTIIGVALEVELQPLVLLTVTVYEPAVVAVYVELVAPAPVIFVPLFFH